MNYRINVIICNGIVTLERECLTVRILFEFYVSLHSLSVLLHYSNSNSHS